MVTPKELVEDRPPIPAMKATGRKTAMSERVMAGNAAGQSDLAGSFDGGLARRHLLLFHVTEDDLEHDHGIINDDPYRQGESQRRVITLRVKPIHSMAAKVAMSALGMETAAMIVGRIFPRKRKTIPAARMECRTRYSCTASQCVFIVAAELSVTYCCWSYLEGTVLLLIMKWMCS